MPEARAPLAALALVATALLAPGAAQAHALLHEIVESEATILRFRFAGGDPPAFEPYEVFAPGLEAPFQSGRINALGEMSFRPDRPGPWRVRVFTADGHGAVIELGIDESGLAAASRIHGHAHAHDYWMRVAAGLGYLLGGFGLMVLWRQRRPRASPG
jgi:nickel transport protein